MSTFIKIGQIVGAHGIQGFIKVEPMTDFLSRFDKGSRLRLDGEWVDVVQSSLHKGRPLIRLAHISDRTSAEKLQWKYLEAPEEEAPRLEEDEYLTDDLLDLEVFTEEGEKLGFVDDVLPMPAQDILVVGEIMIPLVKEFVKLVDLENEKIIVHLIPGMRGEDT